MYIHYLLDERSISFDPLRKFCKDSLGGNTRGGRSAGCGLFLSGHNIGAAIDGRVEAVGGIGAKSLREAQPIEGNHCRAT